MIVRQNKLLTSSLSLYIEKYSSPQPPLHC